MVKTAQYFSGKRITLIFVMDKVSAELHAKLVAAQNGGHFQELLNAETEDGKYEILAQLLLHEMEQLKERRFSYFTPIPNPQLASRYR
jgi:hypothetical protein